MNAEELPFCGEFDAVFSNAVLHWIKRPDRMMPRCTDLSGQVAALSPNAAAMAASTRSGTALVQALERRGLDGKARVPWHFPTPGDYTSRLKRAGFLVDSIALIPRPTPLPGDIIGWLETFAQSFLQGLSGPDRQEYLHEVRSVLEPQLRNGDGIWIADYVRLRFAATKAPLEANAPRRGE